MVGRRSDFRRGSFHGVSHLLRALHRALRGLLFGLLRLGCDGCFALLGAVEFEADKAEGYPGHRVGDVEDFAGAGIMDHCMIEGVLHFGPVAVESFGPFKIKYKGVFRFHSVD